MGKRDKNRDKYVLDEYIPLNVQEAYKEIRTNIKFALSKEGCKKIMVSGPNIGVGSTITCINLAASFAQLHMKTLIIDCDLRSPEVNTLLHGKTLLGLTEFLAGNTELDSIIQTSTYDYLDFICAGGKVSNPAEILGEAKMEILMQKLEQQYEYIFINTPPINLVTDGKVLADQIDGVIVVIKQNETTYKDLENMLWHLKKVNAPILGTILNSCRVTRREKYRYKIYNKITKS